MKKPIIIVKITDEQQSEIFNDLEALLKRNETSKEEEE